MPTKIETPMMTAWIEDKFTSVSDEAYKAIIENSGITISLNGNRPVSGIAFSPFKDAEMLILKKDLSPKLINDYLIKHNRRLSEDGNHLGAWTSEETIYLDVSTVGEKTTDTLEKAMVAKQLAAFDLETFQDIPLGKIEDGNYSRIWENAIDHPYLAEATNYQLA